MKRQNKPGSFRTLLFSCAFPHGERSCRNDRTGCERRRACRVGTAAPAAFTKNQNIANGTALTTGPNSRPILVFDDR